MMTKFAKLPEIVGRLDTPPVGRSPRLLTPVYGSLRRSFSGTSWYCAQAAIAVSAIDGAFTLSTDAQINPRLYVNGALWKLQRILRGRKFEGFKFVAAFNDVLWSQHINCLSDTVIINNVQIYGNFFLRHYSRLNIKPCFYIDGTLTEYFLGYGAVEQQAIGDDVVQRAICMEREAYAHASRIMTMSRSTANHLVEVYGVCPERITVVLPGANIDDEVVPPPSGHAGWVSRDFTIGFVGLFPLRKGLDKLARAMHILRGRGLPIRLRVIGHCPEEIARLDGVEFLGIIDKRTETERFITALRGIDLGCQLSRAELLGIAMLEFIRLGVPVMATDVGGMPDVLEEGGGILVPADITVERLVEDLQSLMTDSERYASLRQAAIRRSAWASWRRAAEEIDAALHGVG